MARCGCQLMYLCCPVVEPPLIPRVAVDPVDVLVHGRASGTTQSNANAASYDTANDDADTVADGHANPASHRFPNCGTNGLANARAHPTTNNISDRFAYTSAVTRTYHVTNHVTDHVANRPSDVSAVFYAHVVADRAANLATPESITIDTADFRADLQSNNLFDAISNSDSR